eukprot:1136200-Pelagomonas_calceolata.AAC.1
MIRSAKKQESRHRLQDCSQDTSGPCVDQRDTLPETLQICPNLKTEEVIATRSTEPNIDPPRKRKRSRYRARITPPVYPTHDVLLDTTQSNVQPPSPDVNPEARDALKPAWKCPQHQS